MTKNQIPIALIGSIADILHERYSHSEITNQFMLCNFSDFPPDDNKTNKLKRIQIGLSNANKISENPLNVLGGFISGIMEKKPYFNAVECKNIEYEEKEKIKNKLKEYGLSYKLGKIINNNDECEKHNNDENLISFIKGNKYKIIDSNLGEGSCGKTYLIKEDYLGLDFVCKKFSVPKNNNDCDKLFKRFLTEIKILFNVCHKNIVKSFNYAIYENAKVAYLLMEYIKGDKIQQYLNKFPEKVNDIFIQTIEGFEYLENIHVIHRDIRNENILVNEDGIVKIIDFGFSKNKFDTNSLTKSLNQKINWIQIPPLEFEQNEYSSQTDIYFLGHLFEYIINRNEDIEKNFKYFEILRNMTQIDPTKRIESFKLINEKLNKSNIPCIEFKENEVTIFQEFTNELVDSISSISTEIKYNDNISDILLKLNKLYLENLLNPYISPDKIMTVFIVGNFKYYPGKQININSVKVFLDLLNNSSKEHREIILKNLFSRIDEIKREFFEEDVPF